MKRRLVRIFCLVALTSLLHSRLALPVHGEMQSSSAPQKVPAGRIAYVDENENVWIINTDGSDPHQITFDGKDAGNLAWSFDGQYLAYNDRHVDPQSFQLLTTLRVVRIDPPEIVYEVPDASFRQWHPSTHQLVYQSYSSGQKMLLDIDTNSEELFDRRLGEWSPNGRYMVAQVCEEHQDDKTWWLDNCHIQVIDQSTYDIAASAACLNNPAPIEFSPDSAKVAFVSRDQKVAVMNVDGTALKVFGSARISYGSDYIPDDLVAFSRDGKSIVYFYYGDGYGANGKILGIDIDTGMISPIYQFKGNEFSSVLSTDGSWMAYTSQPDMQVYVVSLYTDDLYSLGVKGSGLAWEPTLIEGVRRWDLKTLPELLAEKEELIPALENPEGISFLGVSISAPGYDETESRELVDYLDNQQQDLENDLLSADEQATLDRQAAAFKRFVCQEKVTAQIYPYYASAASDVFHSIVELTVVCLGFVELAADIVERVPDRVPGKSWAEEMILSKLQILVDFLTDFFSLLLNTLEDDEEQEAYETVLKNISDGVKIYLGTQGLELEPGFVPEILKDLATTVGTEGLLVWYTGSTQPALDLGASHVRDSINEQVFETYVQGSESDISRQITSLVTEAQRRADDVHALRQGFDDLTDWNDLLSKMCDLLSLVFQPAKIVSILSDLVTVADRIYELNMNFDSLHALSLLPYEAERYCFDTTIRHQVTSSSPMPHPYSATAALASSRLVSRSSVRQVSTQSLATLEGTISAFDNEQEQIVAALQGGNIDDVERLIPELLQSEAALTRQFRIAKSPILAAAPSLTGTELEPSYWQMGLAANDYYRQAFTLYGMLTQNLIEPDNLDAREATISQTAKVTQAVANYRQSIETLLPATGGLAAEPKVMFAGDTVDGLHVELEVMEVSGRTAHDVVVTLDDLEPVRLGDLAGGETKLAQFDVPEPGIYFARVDALDSRSDAHFVWVPPPSLGVQEEPLETQQPPASAETTPTPQEVSAVPISSAPEAPAMSPASRSPALPQVIGLALIFSATLGISILCVALIRLRRRPGGAPGTPGPAPSPPRGSPAGAEAPDRPARPPTPPRPPQPAPTSSETWLRQGWEAARRGDWQTAERCLLEARRLEDPRADQALEWLEQHRPKGN